MRVIIEPASSATWHMTVDNEHLGVSRTPLLSAARKLLARGIEPATELEMLRRGSETVAMRTTVGVAARLTVKESAAPRFAKLPN